MKNGGSFVTPQRLDLRGRFWRRKHIFGGVFAAVFGLTILALVVLPVRYVATGSVIVAEQEPNLPNVSAAWAQKAGDPADLESQLLVIRSPRVLRLAMQVPGVLDVASEECRAGGDSLLTGSSENCSKLAQDVTTFIDYVQNRYSVAAVGRSRVINISYSSGNPKIAQTMANALINAFLDDQRENGSNSREAATVLLRQELRRLDQELGEMDARIQAFRQAKGLVRGATAPISSERLTSISQQLLAAEAARSDALARLQEIKAGQAGGSNDAPSVLASRSIADLKQQLTVVSTQLASLTNTLGPKHPSLLALEREQALIKQRLVDEVATIVASIQKVYDANDALVKSLTQQMAQVKAEVGAATSDEASIEGMVRAADIKRQQYSELSKRASEIDTERRVLVGSTRLISLAELPTKPFFPKKIPFLAAGLTLALLLAVVAVFMADRQEPQSTEPAQQQIAPPLLSTQAQNVEAKPPEPTMASPPLNAATVSPLASILKAFEAPSSAAHSAFEDDPIAEMSMVIGAPVLTRLPFLGNDASDSKIASIIPDNADTSLACSLRLAQWDREFPQALEKLSERLLQPRDGGTRRKILVTSVGEAEGKSLMTLALAAHVASMGRRVLAIECNLRQPVFESTLGLKRSGGLQALLRGEVSPGDVVVATANQNLDAIPAGDAQGLPYLPPRRGIVDLLTWAERYDVVLIDGPSSMLLADADPLTAMTDGVVLCVRHTRTSIGQVVAASSAIKASGGNLLGLALTMVNSANEKVSTWQPVPYLRTRF